jgi:hypothetical protein
MMRFYVQSYNVRGEGWHHQIKDRVRTDNPFLPDWFNRLDRADAACRKWNNTMVCACGNPNAQWRTVEETRRQFTCDTCNRPLTAEEKSWVKKAWQAYRMIHDHACNCGGALGRHETGGPGCLREITADRPEHLNNQLWRLGCCVITATSLFEQRLYYEHLCGCWSRAKGGSTNSIEEHLTACRDKLRIEKRVAEHLRKTRVGLQRAFSQKVDELKRRNDSLRAEVRKLTAERDEANFI